MPRSKARQRHFEYRFLSALPNFSLDFLASRA
jgi:hypothetical protein